MEADIPSRRVSAITFSWALGTRILIRIRMTVPPGSWSTLTDSHKSDRAKTEWMGQTVLYRVLVSMRRSGLSSAYLVSPHGSLVTSPPPAWITRSLKEWGVEFTMDDFEDEDGDEVQGVKRAMDQGLSEMVVSELTARAVEAG